MAGLADRYGKKQSSQLNVFDISKGWLGKPSACSIELKRYTLATHECMNVFYISSVVASMAPSPQAPVPRGIVAVQSIALMLLPILREELLSERHRASYKA